MNFRLYWINAELTINRLTQFTLIGIMSTSLVKSDAVVVFTSFWHSEWCFFRSASSLSSTHILSSLFWIWVIRTHLHCFKDVGHVFLVNVQSADAVFDDVWQSGIMRGTTYPSVINLYLRRRCISGAVWVEKIIPSSFRVCAYGRGAGGELFLLLVVCLVIARACLLPRWPF